jgi:hypothetical protein
MRIVFAVAVALTALGGLDRAQAVEYPWCAQYTGERGDSTNCGFSTIEQCMATVRGVGGYCRENGAYYAQGGYDRRAEPRPRKRVRHD